MDYKRLDNPFPDEDENEDAMIVIQMMINDKSYNAITNDGPIVGKKTVPMFGCFGKTDLA
jgi:hypothetical protein